jgi:class 3 adenylate cyclase
VKSLPLVLMIATHSGAYQTDAIGARFQSDSLGPVILVASNLTAEATRVGCCIAARVRLATSETSRGG